VIDVESEDRDCDEVKDRRFCVTEIKDLLFNVTACGIHNHIIHIVLIASAVLVCVTSEGLLHSSDPIYEHGPAVLRYICVIHLLIKNMKVVPLVVLFSRL